MAQEQHTMSNKLNVEFFFLDNADDFNRIEWWWLTRKRGQKNEKGITYIQVDSNIDINDVSILQEEWSVIETKHSYQTELIYIWM